MRAREEWESTIILLESILTIFIAVCLLTLGRNVCWAQNGLTYISLNLDHGIKRRILLFFFTFHCVRARDALHPNGFPCARKAKHCDFLVTVGRSRCCCCFHGETAMMKIILSLLLFFSFFQRLVIASRLYPSKFAVL